MTYSKTLSPWNIKCRYLKRNQHYIQCFVKLCIYHSLGISMFIVKRFNYCKRYNELHSSYTWLEGKKETVILKLKLSFKIRVVKQRVWENTILSFSTGLSYLKLHQTKSSLADLVLAVNYNRGLTRGNEMCKTSQTDMHHSQNHIKHVRPWVKVQDVPSGRRTINTFFVQSLKRRG